MARAKQFKPPTVNADYGEWLKLGLWPLYEAMSIVLGSDPTAVYLIAYERHAPLAKNEIDKLTDKDMAKLGKAIRHAFERDDLKPYLIDDVTHVHPEEFISWALRKGYDVPIPVLNWHTSLNRQTGGDDDTETRRIEWHADALEAARDILERGRGLKKNHLLNSSALATGVRDALAKMANYRYKAPPSERTIRNFLRTQKHTLNMHLAKLANPI